MKTIAKNIVKDVIETNNEKIPVPMLLTEKTEIKAITDENDILMDDLP